ncbi:MAG TPA: hypothetical protein VK463_02085 [Desulfomonilaceae bacterium]|nr:hypothetical protein [Desulfomonilaceae bacterium]
MRKWTIVFLFLMGFSVYAAVNEAKAVSEWVVCWHWVSSLSTRNQCKLCRLKRMSSAAYGANLSTVCGRSNYDRFNTRRDARTWMRDNCCRR